MRYNFPKLSILALAGGLLLSAGALQPAAWAQAKTFRWDKNAPRIAGAHSRDRSASSIVSTAYQAPSPGAPIIPDGSASGADNNTSESPAQNNSGAASPIGSADPGSPFAPTPADQSGMADSTNTAPSMLSYQSFAAPPQPTAPVAVPVPAPAASTEPSAMAAANPIRGLAKSTADPGILSAPAASLTDYPALLRLWQPGNGKIYAFTPFSAETTRNLFSAAAVCFLAGCYLACLKTKRPAAAAEPEYSFSAAAQPSIRWHENF